MSSNIPAEEFFDDIKHGAHETKQCLDSMSMYRVPDAIRNLRESAYTPRLVSIGPLHSHESHLQPMQDIKKNYLYSFLHRLSDAVYGDRRGSGDRKKIALDDCLELMKNSLEKAKKCYGSNVREKLNERMLVLDGCFVLEFLYVFCHVKNNIALPVSNTRANRDWGVATKRGDPVFGSSMTCHAVQHDLLLLENQLPFFVLDNLFDNTLEKIQNGRFRVPPLRELVIQCFGDLLSPEQKGNPTPPAAGEDNNKGGENQHIVSVQHDNDHKKQEHKLGYQKDEYKHILQLLHRYYYPVDKSYDQYQPLGEPNKKEDDPRKKDHTEFAYSALDLDDAGVKFVADKTNDFPWKEGLFHEPEGYVKWWFRRATFRIPTLWIYDSTEILFRNLIAFEQCTPYVPQHFTSYAFLLDKLINTEKDVQVLQKAGIIRNYLGSNKEASDLVNKLCTEVILRNFYFQKACDDVDEYRKKGWPNFRAQLMRNYFSTPWTFVAFCLAFLAFGIQITSFVRSFTG